MTGLTTARRVSTGNQGLSCPLHMTTDVHHSIRWNVNTSIYGPGSSGLSVVRCASPRRSACTISCLDSLSIATNLDNPFELESTPVRHLREQEHDAIARRIAGRNQRAQ